MAAGFGMLGLMLAAGVLCCLATTPGNKQVHLLFYLFAMLGDIQGVYCEVWHLHNKARLL